MDVYCPYPPRPTKVKEVTAVNLLLASILVFLVLSHLAEQTQTGAMALCALVSAGIMLSCAVVVLLSYKEESFTPVTDKLVHLCCAVQMAGIIWRLCTQTLDSVAMICTLLSATLLGLITAYSQNLEKDHRLIYSQQTETKV